MAVKGRPAKDRCDAPTALTHDENARRLAAVLRGVGNRLPHAALDRLRLAVALVGLPASVAAFVAAVAAATHLG
jgi:hypothetical protein